MKQEQQECEDLKRRFVKKFNRGLVSLVIARQDDTTIYGETDLLSFIAQEIQKAREEERGKTIKMAEGMRKSEDKYSKRDNSQILWTDIGYNQALTDLTNNLTEK